MRQGNCRERYETRRAVLIAMAMWALLGATAASAQDRATIDNTNIIGNRELPKVLYIVPWKKPGPGDLSGMASESVLDEALAPLDRDVFRRQVRYDAQLRTGTATGQQERTEATAPSAPRK
jgi:hypothetical protein